jgi:predicted DNA binding CopG/RHH family protein
MTAETQKTTKAQSRIPDFASRAEEAAFWDTHDITDYLDELKPARVRFAKNLSEGITIRLDPQTLAELRSLAHRKGVGPTTLARMWILEHLRGNGQSPAPQK